MNQNYDYGGDAAESSRDRWDERLPESTNRPNYVTVGSGSTSATAAALMSTLDRDSGYGSVSDGQGSERKRWNPAMTEDRYTPLGTPGTVEGEIEKKHLASHVHQLLYNQNRASLGRQITRTIESLRRLQTMNSKWPVQFDSVSTAEKTRPGARPVSKGKHSASSANLKAKANEPPLRPHAPKRAETSLGEGATQSSSSAEPQQPEEPDRLITPQSRQDFTVLKLNLNMQGLTQAEIAHSMEKKTIASLLDGLINSCIKHLGSLQDRIEDTSSKVLITGDLNAGKSTFCNALLRRKILPEDQQPCTSIFCEVLDAKENGNIEEAHAVTKSSTYNRNDESTYDVYQLHELEKVVTDNERYSQCKIYVKDIRSIDESLLNNGVVDISLIDAPGLNADSLKTTAVFARQEEIDVVVFVVSAANHFTLSAKEFIWNAAREKAYIFMVVNGFDAIRDKERCERMILEQVHNLSPRTFKESSELVHFVSSNAVPTAPAPGPPDDGPGGGGGSGSGSGPSNDFPRPDDDDDESLQKHGEPGSPPKSKGKDKEKLQDFEELEQSLRRFVLEKRARSKLAPAKTYLLHILSDLISLATLNREIASSELDRVVAQLEEIEPAFEKSSHARSQVSDELESTIQQSCDDIYKDTRVIINNSIHQSASTDLGVPYPGILSAFQYAEDLKLAMLDRVSNAVTLSQEQARTKTVGSVNTIKSLGLLHLGDKFPDLSFNSSKMFTGKRARLEREVDFDIEFMDFCDISALWDQHDKLAGTSMALTVAGGALTTRLLGGYGWLDGALGALRVIGPSNARKLILPGIVVSALLTTAYMLHSLPSTLPHRLSHRIAARLSETDYTHRNASRISAECRAILRYPAESLRASLAENVKELAELREERRKVQRESEGARHFFGDLGRETEEGRRRVEDVELELEGGAGVVGGY